MRILQRLALNDIDCIDYYLFQKKKLEKKIVTLNPRHGTLALDMEPSTFAPLNRLNILALSCHALNIISGRE